MESISKAANHELEVIRSRSKGRLNPKDVVDFARKSSTALHKYFEWDDSKAAEKYRLRQATHIIQVSVIVSEETGEKVRAFVSLSTDRKKGSGYRHINDVLDDSQLTAILLEDAKKELESFRRKYTQLRKLAELSGLFDEIDEAVSPSSRVTYEDQPAA